MLPLAEIPSISLFDSSIVGYSVALPLIQLKIFNWRLNI